MKKIYLLANTSADAQSAFGPGFEVTTLKEEAQIVLVRSGTFDFKEFPNCEAVGRLGKGVDPQMLLQATEHKIPLFFAGAANAESVAQMVLLGALAGLRNLFPSRGFTHQLNISDTSMSIAEAQKARFIGREIGPHLSVGILGGCGDIGRVVMQRFLDLGAEIHLYDKPDVLRGFEVGSGVRKIHLLPALISSCDVVTSHVSAKETIVDSQMFQHAREGAVFLDFARGNSFSVEGLRFALQQRNITYVTDFPTAEGLQLQKDFPSQVVCLPHVGANTTDAENACMRMIASVIKRYFNQHEVTNCVNPQVLNIVV